ncbi:hypothetical protein SAMD00024442_57__1 [Candidatus Symbiothrix dinenymphae]|nr:hypothetical protein SAMD00024442_57__1 [Candidatus Symbiothrix dinenymphae]
MNAKKELNKMSIFLTLGVSFCLSAWSQSNTIEVPISIRSGTGPFYSGVPMYLEPYYEDENDPWRKTHLKVSGIPADWTDAKKGHIETNNDQSFYQNYLQGNISQALYDESNWTPDTSNLSRKPLRCAIAYAYGKDLTGALKMVVDANNNLDFSDDVVFTPLELPTFGVGSVKMDSLKAVHSIAVRYERLSGNQSLQEMPALKALYENTDRAKLEVIGVVGSSPAEDLGKMIERFGITWQQILSDETNPIVKKNTE